MNSLSIITGTAIAAAGLALAAPAAAAPSMPLGAADVVAQLKGEGNVVVVNKTGLAL